MIQKNATVTRLLILLTLVGIAVLSTAALCAGTQKSKLVMVQAVTTADADTSSSEVNIITSDDFFARVYVSPNTSISRNGAVIAFDKIKRGCKITCKGNWDKNSSNVFNAAYIFIGGVVTESDVSDRVAAACRKITNKGSSSSKSSSASSSSSNALKMDFFMAVTNGDLPEVKRLLKKSPSLISSRDESHVNSTALHKAAINGRTDVVELLLRSGASINETDDHGWTALHCAVLNTEEDTVRYLLTHKANVNAKSTSGFTPLDVLPAHNPTIEYLLRKYGATSGSR